MNPEITPQELLAAVEAGEPFQVVDVRLPEIVAAGHIEWTAVSSHPRRRAPPFYNLLTSTLNLIGDPMDLGLERSLPVVVVCARGIASQTAARLLRSFGYQAHSIRGGMAAWSVAHRRFDLEPPAGFHTLAVFDRFANGRRTILLGAGHSAVVIDPGRNLAPFLESARELGLAIRAVVDTHLHSDALSGGPGLAGHVGSPYFLPAADASESRVASSPLEPGAAIDLLGPSIGVLSTPGHTAGSSTLVAGDLFLTGDFLLCDGVGRLESGTAASLCQSLTATASWPANGRAVPSYGSGGAVEARLGDLRGDLRRWSQAAASAAPVHLDEREQALSRANRGLETPDQETVRRLEMAPSDLRLDLARWTAAG